MFSEMRTTYLPLLRSWALLGGIILIGAVPPLIFITHGAGSFLTQGAHWWPWVLWPRLLASAAGRTAAVHGLALDALGVFGIPLWLTWDRPASSPSGSGQAQGIYGSAAWRTAASMDDAYVRWPESPAAAKRRIPQAAVRGEPATPAAGAVVGTLTPPRLTPKAPGQPAFVPWVIHRDESCVIFGPSRSGKTQRVLWPTIATLAHARESLVVNDPKPELYKPLAGWLHALGYVVARADLAHPERGFVWEPGDATPQQPFQWNPLTLAQTVWDAGRTAEATQWVEDVVQSLLATQGNSGPKQQDPFWDSVARSALSGTILALLEDAPADQVHLASVQKLLALPDAAYDAWLTQRDPESLALQMGQTYVKTQDQTRTNSSTYTLSQLQNVLSAPIQWFMSASTFPVLRMAAGEPVALFLSTPDQRKSVDPIAVLFFNQLIQGLSGEAAQGSGRLPRRINFVLDEFGQLPPVPQFDRAISVNLSRGIRFVIAVQNLSQFKQYADSDRDTILANCTTWIVLRAENVETAQQLSQRIGQYDHTYTTRQHSSTGNSPQTQLSWGQQTVARPLITLDELMRIPKERAVVLQQGYQAASVYLPWLSAWGWDAVWQPYQLPPVAFPMTRPTAWTPPEPEPAPRDPPLPPVTIAAPPEVDAAEFPVAPIAPEPPAADLDRWEIFDDLPF